MSVGNLKPCRKFMCPATVRAGSNNPYCQKHQREAQKQDAITSKLRMKKKIVNPFYGTKVWQDLRDKFISQNPLCNHCGKLGREVDHIKPLNEDGEALDWNNLQTLCRSCHAKKTWQENQRILHE